MISGAVLEAPGLLGGAVGVQIGEPDAPVGIRDARSAKAAVTRAVVVRAGVLLEGQCVQFGPDQHSGPAAIGQDAHHSGAADASLDPEATCISPAPAYPLGP